MTDQVKNPTQRAEPFFWTRGLARRTILAEALLLEAGAIDGTGLTELRRQAIALGAGPTDVLAELERLLDQHGVADRYRAVYE